LFFSELFSLFVPTERSDLAKQSFAPDSGAEGFTTIGAGADKGLVMSLEG